MKQHYTDVLYDPNWYIGKQLKHWEAEVFRKEPSFVSKTWANISPWQNDACKAKQLLVRSLPYWEAKDIWSISSLIIICQANHTV